MTGFQRAVRIQQAAERSAQHTINAGRILPSTGPFRIRLVMPDVATCVTCHSSCVACDHKPPGCVSNCVMLRAVGYDFFLDLPSVISSPA